MQLSLAPTELDLELYAGDGVGLVVTVTDGSGKPLNVTGAVIAQIRKHKSDTGSPLLAFTVDLTQGATGKITLSLSGANTASLVAGLADEPFRGFWDVQWTATSAQPVTLLTGAVLCDVDVSR